MTTITRVGFCPKCAKESRPRTGQAFRAFGSSRNKYFVAEAARSGLPGFVPFIYKMDKLLGENVILHRICSMDECGAHWEKENGVWKIYPNHDRWERLVYSLTTWNALVLYKHDPMYLI